MGFGDCREDPYACKFVAYLNAKNFEGEFYSHHLELNDLQRNLVHVSFREKNV